MTVDGPPDGTGTARAILAAHLRATRDRSGKTLRELQVATFASDSALSRYLSGRTVPPWNVVAALCVQGDVDPEGLRPVWQRARAARHARIAPTVDQAPPLQAVREMHSALAESITTIATEVAEAIRAVRARGEQVPEQLLTVQRTGADAADRLRAAQRLISPG
ncbi:MAG TPA: helix-turn-helix transcriptional regulator [Actinoplanes sp.]|nr:helix-turn-helix transcriptional regulator [Actinoplanes sp.]